MSSHHRQPVYYVASAPSRSYHPTSHGRSRSGSHPGSSHSGSDLYYYPSRQRRASTSSYGHSPPVYYVTNGNTRSRSGSRYRPVTAYPTGTSGSHGYHTEHRDRGYRRLSHDYGHHNSERRGSRDREIVFTDQGRHHDRGRRHHEEHVSVAVTLEAILV